MYTPDTQTGVLYITNITAQNVDFKCTDSEYNPPCKADGTVETVEKDTKMLVAHSSVETAGVSSTNTDSTHDDKASDISSSANVSPQPLNVDEDACVVNMVCMLTLLTGTVNILSFDKCIDLFIL